MKFAQFTRPDDTAVYIQVAQVLKFSPVPTEGPLVGPLKDGTRIQFVNQEHQDVKELAAEVQRRLVAV